MGRAAQTRADFPNFPDQQVSTMPFEHLADDYSDAGFWRKLKDQATLAGKTVVDYALQLYYASQRPETPTWAKTVIYGALAYFILPIDAVPDVIPGIGYVDDLSVLMTALVTLAQYVDEDVKDRARQQSALWFG